MSQSNKRKNIILTAILAVLLAIYGVIFAKYYINKGENNEQNEENVSTIEETKVEEAKEDESEIEEVEGVSKYATYTENALTVSLVTLDTEGFVTYNQIAGLKDTEIQNSINEEIENLAQEYYNEYKENEMCTFHAYIQANYSNVLSVSVYYSDSEGNNINTGLNYNLTTGEKLTLKELFTSESAGISCIRQEAYNDLLWNYTTSAEDYTDSGEEYSDTFGVENYDELEDEVLNIIYDYKKGILTNFWFTTTGIYISIDNTNISYIDIPMSSYAEYIGIYNRYAGIEPETIYEDTSIARTGLYCMTERLDSIYEILEEKSNYYIDLSIVNWAQTVYPEAVINRAKQVIDEKYQEIQDMDLEEDEFYIVNMVISIDNYGQDSDGNMVYDISANYYNLETTVDLWNNEIKDKLFDYWQTSIEVLAEAIYTNYLSDVLDYQIDGIQVLSQESESFMEICIINADGNEIEE